MSTELLREATEEAIGMDIFTIVNTDSIVSLVIVLAIVVARGWVYWMERNKNNEVAKKLDVIHEDLQGRKKADKNVHPDVAWESIFAPAMRGAKEKIINRLRQVQKDSRLVHSLPELMTQHHGAWKASWTDLELACKTAKVEGRKMSAFLESMRPYWNQKRDECYGELVKSMKGQPDGIGVLETWVSDLKDSLVHHAEEWAHTGKDFNDQRKAKDEPTEMPQAS